MAAEGMGRAGSGHRAPSGVKVKRDRRRQKGGGGGEISRSEIRRGRSHPSEGS